MAKPISFCSNTPYRITKHLLSQCKPHLEGDGIATAASIKKRKNRNRNKRIDAVFMQLEMNTYGVNRNTRP